MVEVFGQADKSKDGNIKSEYPSWYFTQQKDELEETIRHKKYMIENDLIPGSERGITRERLKQEETRLEQINMSQPKLSAAELDEVSKIRKSLGTKIADSMFRRSEMEKGVADAHEEARRMSTPVVKLDDKELGFAKVCDVAISNDGKVNRIAAEKVWKIASRLIEEPSNTEVLRKP